MLPPEALIERVARRLGGPRVLALPLIRILAVLAGFTWLLLTPRSLPEWTMVGVMLLGFFTYSVVVIAALWRWPGTMLRLNFPVLLADLAFALALIHVTGGARSTLFLALLLIAGLQSYYYGIRRGTAVAMGSGAVYVVLVWPTIADIDWSNMAVRLAVLVGTAIGVGLLANVEESERMRVLALSTEAQEREALIQNVVQNLGEGVIVLDPGGRIVAWNRAMERRYAVAATEVLGRNIFDHFPAVRSEPWGAQVRRLLRAEVEEVTLEAVEHETLRKGRIVQHVKGALMRREGMPAGAVLLIEDITERLGLERAARQAEKLAGLGTLAAGLAHELNNPIGIISSRAELVLLDAETHALPAEVRDDLQVIHRHAQRVARMVQNLLSFTRRSSGTRDLVDLNQVVEDTLLLVEKQIAKENLHLARKLAPGLPAVRGDTNALQQVLMNLLTNARDAMEDGGEIFVETAAASDRPDAVRLIVRDTGPGIPPEVLPRIFDPFFTTKPNGTGLGLAISHGIVHDHRGTLDVHSEPRKGTTFVLTLPAERTR